MKLKKSKVQESLKKNYKTASTNQQTFLMNKVFDEKVNEILFGDKEKTNWKVSTQGNRPDSNETYDR
jgi:hypothetical protein